MKKLVLAILVSSTLTACPGPTRPVSQRQSIEVTCLAVSTASKVLTQAINLDKIKVSELPKIEKALAYTDPICNPASGVYPTLSQIAMIEFQKQADELEIQRANIPKE